jgi:hypothetical protein
MANVEIKNPRFYCDIISSHIAKGVTQNGEFDVNSSPSGSLAIQNGSEAELFDNRPLNQVDFDTSSNRTSHVLINIDTQSTHRINFVSILNHNMKSADAKVRVFAGNIASDISSLDASAADTSDIDWSTVTTTEVVNADIINAAADNKSVVVEPAADGSTVFTFTNTELRYWAIQFEGTVGDSTPSLGNGSFDESTDLKIGCIQIGCFYDMPHSPDMTLARSVQYDQNKILKSIGGQKYGLSTAVGKYISSTSKSPFLTTSTASDSFMGRISYDFAFSYIQDTDLLPAEYTDLTSLHAASTRTFIQDVWNVTMGNLLPFIFSVDNTSAGDDAESELIFARFDSDTLDMKQIAHKFYNIRLKITEEF